MPGFLAIKEDITERRVLESQLRQAQKLEGIGQLAAGIAHEINTPTQFVTDNLTFLRDSWKAVCELLERYRAAIHDANGKLPPGVASALEQAERNCDLDFIAAEVPRAIDQGLDGARRVAKIVRAMKEFSHPDSADNTATDINQAIESTITVARNEWKYVAAISTQFGEDLPPVVCYAGEINQVILNPVVNAADPIKEKVKDGEKGSITVRTQTRGEFVEISITDTGTGIPEGIRSRVFDPFVTTKEVGRARGGASHSPTAQSSRNTTAKSGLRPRWAVARHSSSTTDHVTPSARGELMSKRLLFVNDEVMVLNGLRRALHGMRGEWEMTFVESAAAALQALEQQPYDAIVTDMRTPIMDGAQLPGCRAGKRCFAP
jgi:hypothetical protein